VEVVHLVEVVQPVVEVAHAVEAVAEPKIGSHKEETAHITIEVQPNVRYEV
jgi:hypothetical protein